MVLCSIVLLLCSWANHRNTGVYNFKNVSVFTPSKQNCRYDVSQYINVCVLWPHRWFSNVSTLKIAALVDKA